MQNNKFKRELAFCLLFVTMYYVVVNLANRLSYETNTPYSISAFTRTACMVLTIFYLKKKNLLSYYGLNNLKELEYKNLIFCFPMIIIALGSLRYGIHINNSYKEIIYILLEALGVGFAEEMLFRSFLIKAIANKSAKAAIIISSIVFGIIHIFNLLYGADIIVTMGQIVYATALGLMFSIFFYKTNNILPCVICHSVINMTNTFLPNDLSNKQMYIGWLIIIIPSLFYAGYLYKTKKPLEKSAC